MAGVRNKKRGAQEIVARGGRKRIVVAVESVAILRRQRADPFKKRRLISAVSIAASSIPSR